VFALRLWADANDWGNRPDADMVEAYISAAFGRRHHVTSLFRYALCANGRVTEGASVCSGPADFDPQQLYHLGSHVRILSDLHNCEFLIDRINSDSDHSQLLDESSTGDRGVYLMSVSGWTMTGYRIDPGVEAILGLFVSPRSCEEVTRLLNEITDFPRIDASYFEPLVNSGILVAGSQPAIATAEATAPYLGHRKIAVQTPS
jgi:hypothetical protein